MQTLLLPRITLLWSFILSRGLGLLARLYQETILWEKTLDDQNFSLSLGERLKAEALEVSLEILEHQCEYLVGVTICRL
jgi:hypothetical protein